MKRKPEVVDALEKEIQQVTNEESKSVIQKTFLLLYKEGIRRPSFSPSIMTWKFLCATNKIFEIGPLSHVGVAATNQDALSNIMEGYQGFCDWLKDVHGTSGCQVRNPRQKAFLSWQIWEGLHLSLDGFRSLCMSFHGRHSDRAIVPIRMDGSAVDDVFSQVQQRCDSGKGKLKVSALKLSHWVICCQF